MRGNKYVVYGEYLPSCWALVHEWGTLWEAYRDASKYAWATEDGGLVKFMKVEVRSPLDGEGLQEVLWSSTYGWLPYVPSEWED